VYNTMFVNIIVIVLILYALIGIISVFDNILDKNQFRVYAIKNESFFKHIIIGLLISLFLLNSIDAMSTWYAITNIGAIEQNGLMGWVISQGWIMFFLFKMGTISVVVIELYFLYIKEKNIFRPKKIQKKRNPIISIMNLMLFVGLYEWVCINNVGIILMRQKGIL
jgi:hypothetical protein